MTNTIETWKNGDFDLTDECIFGEDNTVEITEYIRGVPFSFGWIPDTGDTSTFIMSSATADVRAGEDTEVREAAEFALEMCEYLPTGYVCYAVTQPKGQEYPYARKPHSNVCLVAVLDQESDEYLAHSEVEDLAFELGCECVDLLYKGSSAGMTQEHIDNMLDFTSQLKGCKVQGVVIRCIETEHSQEYVAQRPQAQAPDYVTKLQQLAQEFKSIERWKRAIQGRAKANALTGTPRDIEPLIMDIQDDIESNSRNWLRDQLYSIFIGEVFEQATKGFAEYYEKALVDGLELPKDRIPLPPTPEVEKKTFQVSGEPPKEAASVLY